MVDIQQAVIARVRFAAAQAVDRQQNDEIDRIYKNACLWYHGATGTQLIFSREEGYHSSGWWKNPDYERCYHLSLSFREPTPENRPDQLSSPIFMANFGILKELRPFHWKQAKAWVNALFGDDAKFTWHEPPFSKIGKQVDVHHFRLFCDPAWRAVKPRGEVYSKQFTEAGWQSWSDVQAARGRPAPQADAKGDGPLPGPSRRAASSGKKITP